MAILAVPSVFVYLVGLFSKPLFSPKVIMISTYNTWNAIWKYLKLRGCGIWDTGKVRVYIDAHSAPLLWGLTRFWPVRLRSGPELSRGQCEALTIISQIHNRLYESLKNEPADLEKQTWSPGEKAVSPKAASGEHCSLSSLPCPKTQHRVSGGCFLRPLV